MSKQKKTTNPTEILCVLDRSGSMEGIANEAIGSFNNFLKEQKNLKAGDCKITVVLFDDQYEVLYDNVDLKKAKELDDKTYYTRGMTALYDAMGLTIKNARERIAEQYKKDSPTVIMVVLTDGQENSSHEYTYEQLKEMLKNQEKEDWNFLFLSSDFASFAQGLVQHAVSPVTMKGAKGMSAGYSYTSALVADIRSGDSSTYNIALGRKFDLDEDGNEATTTNDTQTKQ